MKKIIYRMAAAAACLAMTLASCTNEMEPIPQNEGTKITSITATIGGDMTRLAYEDNANGLIVKWKEGDAFRLYSESSGDVYTATNVSGDGKTAAFSGNGTVTGNGLFAFYPAHKGEKIGEDCVASVREQVIDATNPMAHLSDYNYMIAEDIALSDVEAGAIVFEHQTAVLCFDLAIPAGEVISTISLGTEGDEGIGVLLIPSTGDMVMSKQLTAKVKNAGNELTAYLAVLPSTVAKNLALTVTTTKEGVQSVYNYAVTVESGYYEYKAGYIYRTTLDFVNGGNGYNSVSILDNNTQPADFDPNDNGSASNPFRITNAGQLLTFRDVVNDGINSYLEKYFLLTTDIHITADEWTPIGLFGGNVFKGNFDGGGHTISGVLTAPADYEGVSYGLFGTVSDTFASSSAMISNLHLAADVKAGDASNWVGGIAGHIAANTMVLTCTVSGKISSGNFTGTGLINVGGIVGSVQSASSNVFQCTMTGSVDFGTVTKHIYAGGIAGSTPGTISFCTNKGDITGSTTHSVTIGGIVGRAKSVSFCRNSGKINVTASSGSVAGGIVGELTEGMHTCHNTSTQIEIGAETYCGMLAGKGVVYDCCTSVLIDGLPYTYDASTYPLVPVDELTPCEENSHVSF